MVNAYNVVVSISRLGVTFLVPAVVWVTLMSGLLQLAFDSVRRLGKHRAARFTKVRAKVGAAIVPQN